MTMLVLAMFLLLVFFFFLYLVNAIAGDLPQICYFVLVSMLNNPPHAPSTQLPNSQLTCIHIGVQSKKEKQSVELEISPPSHSLVVHNILQHPGMQEW